VSHSLGAGYREDFDLFDWPDERHARERVARWEALRVPYDDVVVGVFDWPDFAAVHPADIIAAFGECPYSRAQTEAQLAQALPDLTFNGENLVDALDKLRELSGAPIVVDWRSVEQAGMTRESPVTARPRNLTLAQMLRVILEDASAGTPVELSYRIDAENAVIIISAAKERAATTSPSSK
jgi:hypothetical protein